MSIVSKKLFVNVLNGTTAPSNADDNKIYFINESKKIYAKGVYYGVGDDDFSAYKKALGTFLDNQNAADYKDVPAAITGAIASVDGKVIASKTLKVEGDAWEVAASVIYDATTKQINFVDKDGTVLSSVKTSDILGNTMVKSSSYNGATGVLTMVFDNGTDDGVTVEIDLKDLLDVSDVVGDDEYVTATIDTSAASDEKQLKISVNVSTDLSTITDTDTLLADAKAVKAYVDAAIKTSSDAVEALTTRVDAIETTVAEHTTSIADNKTAIETEATTARAAEKANADAITALDTRVTTNETNIATNTDNIKTNTDAIATLNANDSTTGSVLNSIKTQMEDLENYWENA